MKILKPGKVEQRKFVCPKCGCEFAAYQSDNSFEHPDHIKCPQAGCDWYVLGTRGEPYEEPTQDKTADKDELIRLLCEHCGADYSEAADVAQILIANGVTFREV